METTFIIRNEQVRKNAINALLDLPIADYEVSIRKKGKTPAQRRYWHKCISVMCEDTGYSIIELKTIIKRQFFGIKTFKTRKGEIIERDISSEELSVTDYSKLVDHTFVLAEMAGITLPLASHYGLEQ